MLDDYKREGLGIEVGFGLPSVRITRVLDQVIEWRGKPKVIRSDNGSEMCSAEFQHWATRRGIRLMFIRPGKPTQNAFIERFNRTVRHEWLDEHLFQSIEHAQQTATEWLWPYNYERPHHGPRRHHPKPDVGNSRLKPTSELDQKWGDYTSNSLLILSFFQAKARDP